MWFLYVAQAFLTFREKIIVKRKLEYRLRLFKEFIINNLENFDLTKSFTQFLFCADSFSYYIKFVVHPGGNKVEVFRIFKVKKPLKVENEGILPMPCNPHKNPILVATKKYKYHDNASKFQIHNFIIEKSKVKDMKKLKYYKFLLNSPLDYEPNNLVNKYV